MINTKLRNLLNKYQERLDKIDNRYLFMYTVEGFHLKGICGYTGESFKSVCDAYIEELFKNSKTNYANMMRKESEAHFLKFLRGDVRLSITRNIEQYTAYLEKKNWSRATLGIVMRNGQS